MGQALDDAGLASWCGAHRRRVVLAWLAVAVLTTAVAGAVGRRYATDYTLPGLNHSARATCSHAS
jgi:hypothetical protein